MWRAQGENGGVRHCHYIAGHGASLGLRVMASPLNTFHSGIGLLIFLTVQSRSRAGLLSCTALVSHSHSINARYSITHFRP